MNKRGFTLIEIIICISMLVVIGVGSFIGIRMVNKNLTIKELKQITNKAIQASQVYIETNKEAQTQLYTEQNAVKIPLKVLVNEGLLSLKGTNLDENDLKGKYTITALSYENGNCTDIKTAANWDDTTAIYICTNLKLKNTDDSVVEKLVSTSEQYIAKGENPNNWVKFDELSKKVSRYNNDSIFFRILSIDNNKINLIVADKDSVENLNNCKNININTGSRGKSMGEQLSSCLGYSLNSNCFVSFKNFTISIVDSQQIATYITLKRSTWSGTYDTNVSARVILYHEIQNTYDDGASWLPNNFFYGYTQFTDISGNSNLRLNLIKDSDSSKEWYLYPIFALKLGENVELVQNDCSKNGTEIAGSKSCPYKINIKNNYCN